MGADSPVGAGGQGPGTSVEAVVVELMPAAAYRLKLENEEIVIAHATGAGAANFVRLRPGDRVIVDLAPHDPTRGRIVELIEKGS